MPKGRGSNAGRRTARQHGHLHDQRRADEESERRARAWYRLEQLYASSRETAERRQERDLAEARAKRARRAEWT